MKSTTTLIACAIGFAGTALAQQTPTFEEVDANSDGMISQTEAARIEGLDFASADVDQNGSLNRQEYEAASE